MKRNKHKKLSIKVKIFLYLSVFVALMLVLLWLFQVVFLDTFYKAIKTNEINQSATLIRSLVEEEDYSARLDELSAKKEISIRLFTLTKENGITSVSNFYQTAQTRSQALRWIGGDRLLFQQFYQQATESGGKFLEKFSESELLNALKQNAGFSGRQPIPPDVGRQMPESLLYGELFQGSDGTEYFLLIDSQITPVDATVSTLRTQFVWIALILLSFSVVLALLIARKISKPIIQINDSAKLLAAGDYSAQFTSQGYKEIAELGDTLNFAAGELSKVDELRRELIANISHDLRTPLTMITAYSEVMRDLPGENTPENVQVIIDEARRLTTLVNDLLDISKIQSGAQELCLTEYNLTESIHTTLLRYSKLVENDGYHIRFVSDQEVFVQADESKLSQVIYNLINNAVTYTGKDKAVTIRQIVLGNAVRIEVADTGDGIPADELPYIWDRYYKVDKTHKRARVGTGLGLSIVKAVLEMHGARYGVSSIPGQGSTFWFELPSQS